MSRWWLAISSAVAFTVLAVSVHLDIWDGYDAVVREWARPGDVWGPTQLRADYVVEGLRPAVIAILLVAFTVACCVKRRSVRPLVFVAGVGVLTAALTIVAKVAVGRPDTHGTVANSHGGSFPSGHVIAIIVCLGLAALVAQRRVRRWVWLVPALGGALMAASLLVQAAHWSTDVAGGGLLAAGVLAGASASGWRRWSHETGSGHPGGRALLHFRRV
jgi:membrane-associated phospholipid phosphatase